MGMPHSMWHSGTGPNANRVIFQVSRTSEPPASTELVTVTEAGVYQRHFPVKLGFHSSERNARNPRNVSKVTK